MGITIARVFAVKEFSGFNHKEAKAAIWGVKQGWPLTINAFGKRGKLYHRSDKALEVIPD